MAEDSLVRLARPVDGERPSLRGLKAEFEWQLGYSMAALARPQGAGPLLYNLHAQDLATGGRLSALLLGMVEHLRVHVVAGQRLPDSMHEPMLDDDYATSPALIMLHALLGSHSA